MINKKKTIEDYLPELMEEFKDKIPGLTKRKLRVLINNAFLCQLWATAKHKPQRYNFFDLEPHPMYALKARKFLIIPQGDKSYKDYLNKRLLKLNGKDLQSKS